MARNVICGECGEDRPHQAKGFCSPCYSRLRRQSKPEFIRASKHATYLKHREKYIAYNKTSPKAKETSRRWKARNRSALNEYAVAYYKAHPEQYVEYLRRYRDKHTEQVKEWRRSREQRRRARKRNLPATLTRDQWAAILATYDHRCAYCGSKMERLTQDHVTPISKGGGYTPENIVPACRPCNSSKGDRAPALIPATRLLL